MNNELTAQDIKKMQEELEHRKLTLMPELIAEVQLARSYGDLSENFEYKAAKKFKNENESRIRYLERMIKTAVIIDTTASGKEGIVSLGCTVVLKDVETGEEETYAIVGTTEADPFNNKISNESPVGSAILGKKVHDVVVANTPAGELSYQIMEVK